jgi:Flp pilus assembly protein TadG
MNMQTEISGGRPANRRVTFLRHRSGATAVEFALLALPFAVLVFAILEISISFAGQQILSNAADDVARQLRTGQLKSADVTEESLKTTICDRLAIVLAGDCNGLEVDLREFATFGEAAAVRIAFTGDAGARDLDTTGFDVAPGPSGSKNMLRVFYKWPVVTDFMAKMMSNLKDGKTLHFASVTWQNELFED